jgi:hypothetical protein
MEIFDPSDDIRDINTGPLSEENICTSRIAPGSMELPAVDCIEESE